MERVFSREVSPAPAHAWLAFTAGGLAAAAGIVHLVVMPEELEEWWGYGLFFLAAGCALLLLGALFLRNWWRADVEPETPRTLVTAGLVVSGGLLVLYAISRTLGVPFFGPGAGEVEETTAVSLLAVWLEIVLIGCLLTLAVIPRSARHGARQ